MVEESLDDGVDFMQGVRKEGRGVRELDFSLRNRNSYRTREEYRLMSGGLFPVVRKVGGSGEEAE